ncbi:MAG: ATP-binding cassette domain-containing protein [Parvularculaceae bacterium]|nr:MAG: ATP-binding cassette domain-containing protein [Parvularculaceae bacterium]
MGAAYALRLQDVVKSFGGFKAVNGLSFDVSPGEIFGFLGPNGAGKTTTLRMILDIIAPTSGTIDVLDSMSANDMRHRIGYLPEERGLYRKMRAAESIAYFARLRGVPAGKAKARAHELLEEFGLGEFARARNEALSKGMAQKVQLLTTIAHDPDLYILDEPFSGLDPINQATLEKLIRRLKDAGKTIIFSTHVMEHAERLCDRFLILSSGQKKFDGTLDEARQIFPPQVTVRTNAAPAQIADISGVVKIEETDDGSNADEKEYRVELVRGADPQTFLRALIAAGLSVSGFNADSASLHDIFVRLAGDDGDRASSPDDVGEE